MQLTAEGTKLHQKALTALSTIDELQYQARQLQREIKGTIRLGLHIDPAYLQLDRLLSTMRQKHIGVEFHFMQRWSYEQPQDIRNGLLDAGFIYNNQANEGLSVIPLKRFPLCIVGPAKWQSRLENADWSDIAGMPWIWSPEKCNFNTIGTNAFAKHNLQPCKIVVADQEPAISALVSSGIGLGIMMQAEAVALAQKGEVCIWKEPLGEVELCFLYAANRKSDPLILALLGVIKEIWLAEG
jgi:DNA-binding transcriptional LysR family regulator